MDTLKAGNSLVTFPEGTRSKACGPGVVRGRRLCREVSVSTSGTARRFETLYEVYKTLPDAWAIVLDTLDETLIFHTLSNPVRAPRQGPEHSG